MLSVLHVHLQWCAMSRVGWIFRADNSHQDTGVTTLFTCGERKKGGV